MPVCLFDLINKLTYPSNGETEGLDCLLLSISIVPVLLIARSAELVVRIFIVVTFDNYGLPYYVNNCRAGHYRRLS